MRLEARQVDVRRGGQPILKGVDLQVPEGGWVTILGPNGAGKSTLLHTLLGWLRPTEGAVRVGGDDPATLAGAERARRLGWLPQHSRLAEPLPVLEVVAAARFRFPETVAERRDAATEALSVVDAAELADRTWHTLSGGEAQRVALATLVAQDASTWLLDEPANHLDPAVQHRVHTFLARRWLAGQTLVSVTHDLNRVLAAVGDEAPRVRAVGLRAGEVVFSASLADPHLTAHLESLYGVRVHRIQLDVGWRLLLEGEP